MKRRMGIGPGAASFILVIVVLILSALSSLSLMRARSSVKLSERSAAVVEKVYQLNSSAEETLARADALLVACAQQSTDDAAYLQLLVDRLPEDMELTGRTLTWTEQAEDGRLLLCGIVISPWGDFPRYVWVNHEMQVLDLDEEYME